MSSHRSVRSRLTAFPPIICQQWTPRGNCGGDRSLWNDARHWPMLQGRPSRCGRGESRISTGGDRTNSFRSLGRGCRKTNSDCAWRWNPVIYQGGCSVRRPLLQSALDCPTNNWFAQQNLQQEIAFVIIISGVRRVSVNELRAEGIRVADITQDRQLKGMGNL